MHQSRVATRYATALFNEAKQIGALETIISDTRGLRSMLKESHDFALFVASPVIKTAHKGAALKAIAEKADLSSMTKNFLALLVEKSRVNELAYIIDSFEALYNKENSILPVEITSAIELDTAQKDNLVNKIAMQTGKKPQPTYSINPSLIGGFTVKVGDSMMDGSIKQQLVLLKKRLLEGTMN
jgi:F-type H+-transporting ATPase subunit delta